jgi:hypothetical protein
MGFTPSKPPDWDWRSSNSSNSLKLLPEDRVLRPLKIPLIFGAATVRRWLEREGGSGEECGGEGFENSLDSGFRIFGLLDCPKIDHYCLNTGVGE